MKHLLLHIAALGVLAVGSRGAAAQQPGMNPDEIFTRLDRNEDGKLTADEVSGDAQGFFNAALKFVDRDKNGQLSKQEFMLAVEYRELIAEEQGPGFGRFGFDNSRGRRPPIDSRQIFQQLDANRDGKLTMDELPQEVRPRMKPAFDRLGREEITLEEFVALRQRFAGAVDRPGGNLELFQRLDTNKDGKLALSEVPEPFRERLGPVFERLGKDALTPEDFARMRNQAAPPQRPGANRRPQESDQPNPDRRKKSDPPKTDE